MGYIGQQITTVFPTSISVDSATIKGDTTIGDASATDKKILFDGNAQDFHIGLDDSNDSLTIGLGSTLGTTSHMVIDANGHITKPLQSAFSVRHSVAQNNQPINTYPNTIQFDTEVFDQNSDFSGNTFTAPVTGKYQFNMLIRMNQLDTGATYYQIYLVTSNRAYYTTLDPNFSSDLDYYNIDFSVLADMDAGDTATVTFYQNNGTAQTDLPSGTDMYFSGYLVA